MKFNDWKYCVCWGTYPKTKHFRTVHPEGPAIVSLELGLKNICVMAVGAAFQSGATAGGLGYVL